jgi:hypothetical protein
LHIDKQQKALVRMSHENLNGTTTPGPTELFSKETFLTSLRGGGDNSNDMKIVVEEPQS